MITDSIAVPDSVNASRRVRSARMFAAAAQAALLTTVQIAALSLISTGASAVVAWFHAPVPGNVLGLALLFALLCGGIVKVAWLEPAATLLVNHFAFFFIPITVGLMGMGRLFALQGGGILAALAVSAAVGMAVCGLTSQWLMTAQSVDTTRRGSEPNA